MKKRKTFGQIIITAMFIWSALLCHFEASSLREEGNISNAALYWFFGFTAVLGAFRFKIAELVYGLIELKKKNKKKIRIYNFMFVQFITIGKIKWILKWKLFKKASN